MLTYQLQYIGDSESVTRGIRAGTIRRRGREQCGISGCQSFGH